MTASLEQLGPMSCIVTNENIECEQTEKLPVVKDSKSFSDMLGTCYYMATSDDERVNEEACETFAANILKKPLGRKKGFRKTKPCKWMPGKVTKKGVRKLGWCTGNEETLTDMAFGVYYEG